MPLPVLSSAYNPFKCRFEEAHLLLKCLQGKHFNANKGPTHGSANRFGISLHPFSEYNAAMVILFYLKVSGLKFFPHLGSSTKKIQVE